ncbi:nuclear transport factor 2 family protein [Micromonospora sp. ATA32]|nr:nuclear transport factor 2 family protein [Micromonospora sp. ATA32]
MTEDLRARSASEVFDEHLRLSKENRFADDIERNVSPDCVVLERRGVFRGHAGVQELARWLSEELPGAHFTYTNRLVESRIAFLEWTADAEGAQVRDGADSFVIEDGWIVAQTIHYTVERVEPWSG